MEELRLVLAVSNLVLILMIVVSTIKKNRKDESTSRLLAVIEILGNDIKRNIIEERKILNYRECSIEQDGIKVAFDFAKYDKEDEIKAKLDMALDYVRKLSKNGTMKVDIKTKDKNIHNNPFFKSAFGMSWENNKDPVEEIIKNSARIKGYKIEKTNGE